MPAFLAAILTDLGRTVIAGFVLAVIMFLLYWVTQGYSGADFGPFFFRWLHVLSGVMWIGLLWYFNFVQIPNMAKIPDEQKPAIGKVIAPAALFWFRWAAMATIVTGLLLAMANGYLLEAILLGLLDGVPKHMMIGIGMWLGTIMWFNVWFIIWPNQKHLAEPEARARHRRRGRRHQGQIGAHGHAVLAHQHPAVDPHAVRHGGGAEPYLTGPARAEEPKRGRAC
jgi:uncharacterized membrane protein